MRDLASEVEDVGAVVGLRDAPAADAVLGVPLQQVVLAHRVHHEPGHGRRGQHDGQPAVAAAQFLERRRHDPAALVGRQSEDRLDRQAQGLEFGEDLPQRRARRDHLVGIVQLVELAADGPQHLVRETTHACQDGRLGFALLGFQSRGFQLDPDAVVCHRSSPW